MSIVTVKVHVVVVKRQHDYHDLGVCVFASYIAYYTESAKTINEYG